MMFNGNLSDAQASSLGDLDPAQMMNMRGGNGFLPDLAAGAADGSGASSIVPNRAIPAGGVLLVRDFTLQPDGLAEDPAAGCATVGPFTIRSTAKPAPEPKSLQEWIVGATRLSSFL